MEPNKIQQLLEQQPMLDDQMKNELLLSNVYANFMQRYVSSKYFMLNMEYADQLMRLN